MVAATLVGSESALDVDTLLAQPLASHPDLKVGQLDNGLRYVLLPNKVPPNRFEAHLEIHAGSVDERTQEQGIAHLVEHVTFLGSRKREGLLGTGARSNAYTDFHHTVFHVHSPRVNANTGQPMLPQVLEALVEIAFEPEFLTTRIEKERRAVLSEAQMMNTIEYRVDCQLLQYLHAENALGCRFPIGKTDQVKHWDGVMLKDFWGRWYFPANATLYVVGEMDGGVQGTEELIKATFGKVAPVREELPAAAALPNGNGNGAAGQQQQEHEQQLGPLKQRHAIRPPVEHRFGCGPPPTDGARTAGVSVFRHRLLQHFMLSIFCKLPIRSISTMDDLRRAFMVRILLSVLQFRINGRYVRGNPPFIAVEWDHSDSGREGCAVSTLTITSEPKDWRGAIQVAAEEVRRLQLYGVTRGELERYKAALLRDSEQLAEQAGSVPSVDNLEFVMDSLSQAHTVMDQKQGHAALLDLADTITSDEVNALSRSLLSYVSHYGREGEAWEEYQADPSGWAEPGPTWSTAIVACIPAFMDDSGLSTGGGAPLQRGAHIATMEHVDVSGTGSDIASSLDEDSDGDIPEGAVRFELEAEQIAEALAEAGEEVERAADVEVPESLLPAAELEVLLAERQPRFVPVDGEVSSSGETRPSPDPYSGISQRRLSNGIKVNYRHTDNEPRAAMLRLVAAGGRACEPSEAGPSGAGVVTVGVRTLSESGTVGNWGREQVELFCISKLINCVLEADEEFVCMDFHFAVGEDGLKAVLELLHLFLEQPRWEEGAMERAKQMFTSHFRSLPKNLERATADRVVSAMVGPDRRLRDPRPEEIEALTLESMRDAVMAQIHARNIEVTIVGDFEEAELEDAVLKYLGTVSQNRDISGALVPAGPPGHAPIVVQDAPMELRRQEWHLKDSDERAVAYIAGRAPSRWGSFGAPAGTPPPQPGTVVAPFEAGANASPDQVAAADASRRSHPLYPMVTLSLLTEVINSRLFTTVRDALGLTYDVSFELSLFDRLDAGWFVVNVTSTPQKIRDAMNASLRVMRQISTQRITPRELLRAQRTLVTRHESDLKDNTYWLGLLTHLQADCVPYKSLDCLRDLKRMYELVTIDDVYQAYAQFDLSDNAIFTCIGTSGKEPPPPPPAAAAPAGALGSFGALAQGAATATGAAAPKLDDPVLAALSAVAQQINLAQAMKSIQQQREQQQQQHGGNSGGSSQTPPQQ